MRTATITRAWSEMADLVLPRRCVGCGRAGPSLCGRCLPARPRSQLAGFLAGVSVVAGADYHTAVRAALLAYKERGRRELAGPLAGLLAGAVSGLACARGAVLVPVPSARAVARERGGDHVRRLARQAGGRLGMPVCTALTPLRAVRDQAGLGVVERSVNRRGALGAASPGPGAGWAVVVDDIVTTGATLTDAIDALRRAGWSVAGAAVVAATPRRAHS